ncbi:MAG: PfkB family carbohydrate kinase [Planctomycetota bacterium]|jgi:sugar/nucleoside kinase (ribokinase family)
MSDRAFDVITVGSATRDVFVRSDLARILSIKEMRGETAYLCLDHGGKQNVSNIFFTTGGGATNAAAVMAVLGLKVAAVACVGADNTAEEIRTDLVQMGADASLLVQHPSERSGYSVIISSFDGERTVLTYRGASTQLDPDAIDWEKLASTGWIYLGSLHGRAAELYPRLAEFCRGRDVKLAVNPGSTQFRQGLDGLKDVLAATDVLLLNREEAVKLVGATDFRSYVDEERCSLCEECVRACPQGIFLRDGDRINVVGEDRCVRCNACVQACPTRAVLMEPWARNMDELFERISRVCPGIVVITDGRRGVQCSDGRTRWLMPVFEVPVVCTLGAGDAFGSSFVASLLDDPEDVGRALAWGAANAASVVTIMGAKHGILDRANLEAFLARQGDWRATQRSAPLSPEEAEGQ